MRFLENRMGSCSTDQFLAPMIAPPTSCFTVKLPKTILKYTVQTPSDHHGMLFGGISLVHNMYIIFCCVTRVSPSPDTWCASSWTSSSYPSMTMTGSWEKRVYRLFDKFHGLSRPVDRTSPRPRHTLEYCVRNLPRAIGHNNIIL